MTEGLIDQFNRGFIRARWLLSWPGRAATLR